jgi:hypothetical protein
MDATQLALFPDTAVTGSGQPAPWPAATPEPETLAVDPDQLAFGDTDDEDAA